MSKKWMNRLKLTWLKGMEMLGTAASNLVNNAKHKVAEINLETRRREISTEVSMLAFDMWQKGEKLPEPLEALLRELSDLDERLSVLRAQKYAHVHHETVPSAEAENGGETSPEILSALAAFPPEQVVKGTSEETIAPDSDKDAKDA